MKRKREPLTQCELHPEAVMVSFCPSCRGSVRSKKKAKASRLNGMKGGRPKGSLSSDKETPRKKHRRS